LQEMILFLIQQVKQLQYSNTYIENNLLQPMLYIPKADMVRGDLRLLETTLERIEDMIYCKHGLSGVLSAHDDLTAIDQIQYGRQLLNGSTVDNSNIDNHNQDNGSRIELQRLHAFKTVSEQLNQYEQLVVTNLRDELVEVFLSWSGSTTISTAMMQYDTATLAVNDDSNTSAFRSVEQDRIQTRVREIVNALHRCKALTKTKDTYASRLQDVIRMTVRTTVGEFASDLVAATTPKGAVQSVAMGASAMTLNRFLDCLDLIFEQLLLLLSSASSVNDYFVNENLRLDDSVEVISDVTGKVQEAPLASVIATACELTSKSMSELLRLRKDAHSLVTLAEMKAIWDACISFANQVDKLGNSGHYLSNVDMKVTCHHWPPL
jgi:vacuolar protein sorting-associated protein 54